MESLRTLQPVIPVVTNWSKPLIEWFRRLLTENPQKPSKVTLAEWRSWLVSAEAHGLCSLVFGKLRLVESAIQPPEEIVETLRTLYFAEVARIMVRRNQLNHLQSRFEQAGIDSLVLKGAALGESVYSDVFRRPASDLDILIKPVDYIAARNILLEEAYRSKRGDRSFEMDWTCDEEFLPSIMDGETKYVVELHWALTSNAQLMHLIDLDQLFDRSERISGLLGRQLKTLSPVDSLLYACQHLIYKHVNEIRLIWLYDIHLIANEINRLGLWEVAIEQSRQWQTRLALKYCLELASFWFGTSIPENIYNSSFAPASLEEKKLFNLILFQLEHSHRRGWLRKHLYQLSRLEGYNRIRYLGSRLFPTRREIEASYPRLRSWPGPLIYIGRLAMMFGSKK